jgi:protease-4
VARRRGIVIVLSIVGGLLFVVVAMVALLIVVASRGPSIPASSTLVLRPAGALREVVAGDLVGQLVGRDEDTVQSFVSALHMARRDSRISNVLLMPSTLDLPYWGKLQELRDAVLDFRKSGKKVIAFLQYGSDREYYLASAADRVFLLPTSPLDLTGVASYELFLRGFFDKIGATPDFVAIGPYKTAPNQLTEKKMTPAHREMSEALNRDAYDQLVQGIAAGRKKTEAEVRRLLDQGPFGPEDALRVGLVDDLAYEDELDDKVPGLRIDDKDDRHVEVAEYRRVHPSSAGITPKSRIAVLYAVGAIVSGKSGYDPLNGEAIGSDTLVEQIRRIKADSSIKGVVLRIDSPGGSAVASDVIWRELTLLRDQKPSRPLVTSMSDLAASGGYYIAAATQAIVAQPGTLTGSIGIFSGKIALGGSAAQLGITTETVKNGANADIYSPLTPFTPPQRDKLLDFMQSFYDGFVEKVADARHTTPERIDAVAQGRVWTGAQAKEHGLVDALGGLDTAVAMVKERAHIPASEDVELVTYPPRRTFYEALSEQLGGGSGGAQMWGLLAARRAQVLAPAASLQMFRRGEPLALMPMTRVR